MDGILEILGYIAVGIFVIFNRLYRRKKTNENDYGLTEDGKLKLPFIDELIEPETESAPEQNELIANEIEGIDEDEILDEPIVFEPNITGYSEQKSDELESNSTDRVLTKIPPQRRKTLIAQRRESMGETTYEFDTCMQGSQETVFFHL